MQETDWPRYVKHTMDAAFISLLVQLNSFSKLLFETELAYIS